MKIKFRFHSGSFDDSMQNIIEVGTLCEIEELIKDRYHLTIAKSGGVKNITYDYVGVDNRNDWHTYYVVVNLYSSKNSKKQTPLQFVAGYSNGVPID